MILPFSLSPLFRGPVGCHQQSDAHGNGDAAINCPSNLSRHETTWKHIDPLQEPRGARQNQKNGNDIQCDSHHPSPHHAGVGLPPGRPGNHDWIVVITSPSPIMFCGFPLPCWAMNRPYCKTVMIDRIKLVNRLKTAVVVTRRSRWMRRDQRRI